MIRSRCDERFRGSRVLEMTALWVLWFIASFESTRAERERRPPPPPVEWQGYSIAFHLLLPVAGFLLLWGKRDLFNKLLLQVDRSCLSVFCPSFSKRQKLLKWAVENLPSTWSSSSRTLTGGIPDLWKDGSLLCTLINMAVPGACQNPPKHWKKSPTHAQALAYKYLGIIPVFQDSDFKEPLTPNQERKFLLYLQDLQQAIKSRGCKEESPIFSQNYLVKGMGLQNGEQYKKTTFYVYSNSNNTNCSNVLVYIRGPYDTQGTATIPAFYVLNTPPVLHKQYRIAFKKEARKSFLKSIALDFSSLVNFERKPASNDIPIHVEMETERAKVSYIPLNYGVYEVNLITNGEPLVNSPFTVSVSENDPQTKDSFDTTETVLQELPTRRRIVARFIDCVNERILLDHDAPDGARNDEDDNRTLLGPEKKAVPDENVERLVPILSVTEPDDGEAQTREDLDSLETHGTEEAYIPPAWRKIDEEPDGVPPEDFRTDLGTPSSLLKRPTSIVTPFLVTPNSGEKPPDEDQETATKDEDTKITDSYNPRKLIQMRTTIKNSYVERLKAILVQKLSESEDAKTIKNLVNTSNKLKSMNDQDENNNSSQSAFLRVTSPICPAHIVPEVEDRILPPSERRLTRQPCLSLSSSNNSSFFEKENEDVVKEFSDNCSLRLLTVLDTIRNSSSLSRTISNSTPNISTSKGSNSEGSNESRSSFIEAREYWLSLSTENFTKRPKENRFLFSSKKPCEKYRSAEDITSISKMSFSRKLKRYSSLNQKDFEAIEFMSLEERKKMLLQDKYEEEKMGTRFVKRKVFVRETISETDKKTRSATPQIPAQEAKHATNLDEKKTTTQFKRAFNFFRNLEKSTSYKKKSPFKPKPEVGRRYSLDFVEKKKDRSKMGGSLKLPKTSEKFSIARIYLDIMENKRGSFRGTPNRAALHESLASLATRTEEILDKSDDPIELGIFKNKVRPRRRKSLKSIFNVHY